MKTSQTRTAPSAVHRPSDAISNRAKNAMGLPVGRPDPTPGRKALLEYIDAHGPLRAADMAGAGPGHTPQLVWLQKEGYAECDRGGTKNAMWDITALGRRWILRVDGTPVAPRTIAFSGCVTEAHETRWPDVRQGAMDACALQSRGIE